MEALASGIPNRGNLNKENPGFAFFSYSRKDKSRIRDLSTFLKREELQPWADNQLKLGEVWQEQLKNKITDCKLFVILMTEDSRASRFVKWEIDMAIQLSKPVLAIKLNAGDEIFHEFKNIINLDCVDFWDFAKPNWGLAETIRNFLHPDQIPSQRLVRQRLEVICFILFEQIYNKVSDVMVFEGIGSGMQFNVNANTSLHDMTDDKWLLFFNRLDKAFGWKVFAFPDGFRYLEFFPTIGKLIDFMTKHVIWEDIRLIQFKVG
jgi:hypothetical protein